MSTLALKSYRRCAHPILAAALWFPAIAGAQARDSTPDRMVGMADHAMDMQHMGSDMNMAKHMLMSPARPATAADSVKARALVAEIRRAISKYEDPAAAEAAGYRMFLPEVKKQHVYHYTSYRNAFAEAFRFDPDKPTSLLYVPSPDGSLKLIGAMYTAPKRWDTNRLDKRIPLSIARWHKHVNWCLPPKGSNERWLEKRDGKPVFGPESPIATRDACEAVGGVFHPTLFGWMVHANVFAGDQLGEVFADVH